MFNTPRSGLCLVDRRCTLVRVVACSVLVATLALGGCIGRPAVAETPFQARAGAPNDTLLWVAEPSDTLRVATWNIEWLDATPLSGHLSRTEADYARLTAYAQRLDADIVALQEVEGVAAAARVFSPDEYRFYFEPGTHPQKTGFAVRKTVQVLETSSVDDLKLGRHGLRAGIVITISVGDRPLRLMNVHMKSGCFEHPLPAPRARPSGSCETLAAQLPILERWLDEQIASGVPTMLLGDFNRRLVKRGDAFWAEIDDGDPIGADLVAATEGRTSSCWNAQYPDYIDHIVFDEWSYFWYVTNSFEQLVFDAADARYKSVLSDHCPISVRVTPPVVPKG